jgi:ABC-type proline/glycine betaine transport system ATPase subunit
LPDPGTAGPLIRVQDLYKIFGARFANVMRMVREGTPVSMFSR